MPWGCGCTLAPCMLQSAGAILLSELRALSRACTQMHLQVAVLQNSVVEILCRQGHVEFSITNPPDCVKMSWENGVAKCTPYR